MAQNNTINRVRPNGAAVPQGSGVSDSPTMEELIQRLAAAEAENAALRAMPEKELYLKIAAKGGISLYGLSAQWPVTLYVGQWERLLAMAGRISKTIAWLKANHSAHLATKGVDLPEHLDPTTGKPTARSGAIKLLA